MITIPYLTHASLTIARKNLDIDIREKIRQDYEDVIIRLTAIANNGGLVTDDGLPLPGGDPIDINTGIYSSKMYSGNRIATVPNFGGLVDTNFNDREGRY